jgi:tetratricopeptide (TPR) repeat protein
VAKENRFHRSAIRLAQRATELAPENKLYWRHLAYAELHVGQAEESVAHFRKGLDKDIGASAVGLALALITRASEQDLAEACKLIEENHTALDQAFYTEEALQTLAKAPLPQDPQLRERLQTLLAKHKEP